MVLVVLTGVTHAIQVRSRNTVVVYSVMGTSIGLYVSRLSTEVIDLNDENFDEIVNNSRKPMLVAFTADW